MYSLRHEGPLHDPRADVSGAPAATRPRARPRPSCACGLAQLPAAPAPAIREIPLHRPWRRADDARRHPLPGSGRVTPSAFRPARLTPSRPVPVSASASCAPVRWPISTISHEYCRFHSSSAQGLQAGAARAVSRPGRSTSGRPRPDLQSGVLPRARLPRLGQAAFWKRVFVTRAGQPLREHRNILPGRPDPPAARLYIARRRRGLPGSSARCSPDASPGQGRSHRYRARWVRISRSCAAPGDQTRPSSGTWAPGHPVGRQPP